MPAYFDTGFCVRQPSWHREEVLLDEYPVDWNDAREKAGLLWEPVKTTPYHLVPAIEASLFETLPEGAIVLDDGSALFPAPAEAMIVRSDTRAVIGSGMKADYTPVLHAQMGEILEALIDAEGTLKFETAGSVNGGSQVWALVYLDEPIRLPGDDSETLPFMALLNSHDGGGACKALPTSVRVVCWNTYNAASMQGDRTGAQFTFRHSGDVAAKIEEAKEAVRGLRKQTQEWVELATELLGLPADERALNHFLSEFIPMPEADVVSDRVRENIDKARAAFRSIYLDSPTNDAHKGTALGLVDASVEYLDHVRGFRSTDTYLGRTILKPEPMKAKAVTLARRVCGVG